MLCPAIPALDALVSPVASNEEISPSTGCDSDQCVDIKEPDVKNVNASYAEAHAPKLWACAKKLVESKGKQLVFCNDRAGGLYVLANLLRSMGFEQWQVEKGADGLAYPTEKKARFVVLDKSVGKEERGKTLWHTLPPSKHVFSQASYQFQGTRTSSVGPKECKKKEGGRDGVGERQTEKGEPESCQICGPGTDRDCHGEYVRIALLYTPDYKEGVSFFNIRGMHLLDAPTTMREYLQIVGRGRRYCSHKQCWTKNCSNWRLRCTLSLFLLCPPRNQATGGWKPQPTRTKGNSRRRTTREKAERSRIQACTFKLDKMKDWTKKVMRQTKFFKHFKKGIETEEVPVGLFLWVRAVARYQPVYRLDNDLKKVAIDCEANRSELFSADAGRAPTVCGSDYIQGKEESWDAFVMSKALPHKITCSETSARCVPYVVRRALATYAHTDKPRRGKSVSWRRQESKWFFHQRPSLAEHDPGAMQCCNTYFYTVPQRPVGYNAR